MGSKTLASATALVAEQERAYIINDKLTFGVSVVWAFRGWGFPNPQGPTTETPKVSE